VQGRRSTAPAPDLRWEMDLTHTYCGADGEGHPAAIIDRRDRKIVRWKLSLRGRGREAERALKEACLARFGTLRPDADTDDQERQCADLHRSALPRCLS
jgi:hypothetical protein